MDDLIRTPMEALDLHVSYWEQCGTEGHEASLRQFSIDAQQRAFTTFEREGSSIPGWDLDVAVDHSVIQYGNMECNLVNEAITLFVSPDVADATEQLGGAMPPDMLQEFDLPFRQGFAVLGQPWVMTTADGEQLPVRAFAWDHLDGVPTTSFEDGEPVLGYTDGGGVSLFIYIDTDRAPHIRLYDQWCWEFNAWWGESPEIDDSGIPYSTQVSDRVGLLRRQFLTLWRFMNEEIIRTERTRPPRAAARRWDRADMANMPEDGCIVSAHLRRYAPRDDDSTREGPQKEVMYSHRWWVTGHYRWNPRTERKDIWVRPYPKGPDGAPFIIKERLVSVDR